MLIDWYTVGAQALNFLILVGLMKHFLYKPILHAIDAREKRIAAELADATTKQADAKNEREVFQHKTEELDQQRAALMSKATDEANAERTRLVEQARHAADALSAKRQEGLRNDALHLNQAIGRRAQQEVFAIARKTLTDLATTSLEERMTEVLVRRLRELDTPMKQRLTEAIKTAAEPAIVRSAFELSSDQRAAIQKTLNEVCSAEVRVRFETAPALVSGIEITTNGERVAWSISDYLTSLEKSVAELLKEQEKRESKPEPKPEAKFTAKRTSKPESKPTPNPGSNVEPAAKTEAKPEAKPASESA